MKGKRDSLFWTSYSDLMTSLFFVILVLFIVAVIAMGKAIQKERNTRVATEKEIEKIRTIENSIQNIDTTWFDYNEQYKKHVLKIDVSFPIGESDITYIPLQTREDLYQAGLAINAFLNKAVTLVEQHLNTPGYSVEQLSKDLCMERTGLYKKLTNLLDKSPSLFIRSIRLKRAADLLCEGELSISEIAEQVGFSSASYLSKCFFEEYGCKPSEYARQQKNKP